MKRSFLVIAAAGALIGLYSAHAYIVYPGLMEWCSSYVVYPVLQAQQKIVLPIKEMLAHRRTASDLEHQLATMRAENEALKADNIELQALLRYADDVSELVEFKKNYNFPNAIVAHVLAKHISEQAHFVLLDAGANKGVQKNMVGVYNNYLLGKIVEVYPWYSKMQLITDRDCKVAACCAITNASGIHEGCNNEVITHVNRVSHLAQLQEGDLVLSSGEGLIFPQGFGLGRISSFEQNGLVYTVNVEPLINMRDISYCCIVSRGATPNKAVEL